MINNKKIHKIEFEMLKELVRFLDENEIKYFLDYGTLIGAIRHKGFIPWDDDIDISMLRDEYDKFINIVRKKKNFMLNDYLAVKAPELKNTNFCFCKICNLKYKVHEKSIKLDDEYLWIDVFPYDKMCNDEKKNRKNFKRIKKFNKLILIKISDIKSLKELSKSKIKFFIKMIIKPFLSVIPINTLFKKIRKIATKYNKNEYLTAQNITSISNYYESDMIIDLNDLIDVEFEGEKFKTIKTYDKHLKKLYGDYMIMPSKDKKETHILETWEEDDLYNEKK